MSRRLPQGFSKGGMGCVIGCDAVNISYLYHKEQDCVKAGFRRPLQFPDVLRPANTKPVIVPDLMVTVLLLALADADCVLPPNIW